MSERLDLALVRRDIVATHARAIEEIRAGNVLVDETVVDKPGARVGERASLRLRTPPARFVSRGGLKLEAGLDAFGVAARGRVCADLGASTGGFTDCLLQRGASRVFAVDVGYGQLAWSLRQDARVVVLERTNARQLTTLAEPVSLVVGDLSFVSVRRILPAIRRLLAGGGDAVILVKPQFEVTRSRIAAGGVVVDEAARNDALSSVQDAARDAGFQVVAHLESPLVGAKAGNREWLVHLVVEGQGVLS
ncbi:MAG: TlyA family RNA methyltransferase [Myxococcales bacterium]|nr:TlyA family RNA methyltransferase [Myxococcales bacterium]